MKKLLAAALLMTAGYAASAQTVTITPSTEKDDVEAPEITEMFKKNLPELGPMKWRKLGNDSTQFYLMSLPVTKDQNDINQSVRVIGVDDGDGVLQVNEIKNIGVNNSNRQDRNISEDLFIETKPDGWSVTRTYRKENKRRSGARGITLQTNDVKQIIYFIDNSLGFETVLETARELLYPAPKKAPAPVINEL